MIYGLYLSTAGMISQQYRQDVIANNVANVDTAGFKRDVAVFRARQAAAMERPGAMRYAQPVLDDLGGGILANPTYTVFRQGAPELTYNDLDVTIIGSGFLAVRSPDGTTSYTRDGRMTVDTQGYLTMATSSNRVLDTAGGEVQLDPGLPVQIAADGTVSQAGQVINVLGVSDFDQPQALRKVGENLFQAPPQLAARSVAGHFKPGSFERSTVDPTTELVAMIQAQRAYEANASLIRVQDQTLGRVVNDLARNI